MGDWHKKSDADTGKRMGSRPAGAAVEPCPQTRKLESLFVPPESVTVAAKIEVTGDQAVETRHTVSEEHAIETRFEVDKEV